MKKIGNIVKAISFLIVCFACLAVVSKVLQYEHEMQPDLSMKEFYDLDKNSAQVLVLGSSHTTLGFSPIECYKQTGITSFNLSTAKQPMEVSYYLLEEALKSQSPEVVIYDVAGLFYKRSEINIAKFRYSMDSMPLSWTKVKMASAYAEYHDDIKPFAMGEALCPIYYYHDRWDELDEEEFDVNAPVTQLKGQVIRTYITEIDFDMEAFDKKLAKKIEKDPNSAPVIRKSCMAYLEKIKKLCDENNVKLLLTTTPTNRWNSTKKELSQQVADKLGVDFLDLNQPDGVILNYSTDMADGNHVNASGAKKTTKYYTDYLVKQYGLKGSTNKQFDESVKYYDAYYDNMLKYDMETDFNQYLSLLNENEKDLTIFISGKGDVTAGLNSKDLEQLQQLGCKTVLGSEHQENSYLAVISGGKLVYENVNKDAIAYQYTLQNGTIANLSSNGDSAEAAAAINIDNKNYAINSAGLNIVVYDNQSGCVVDSVAFNTHDSQKKWWRSGERSLELFMFKKYRNWVLENY